MGNDIFADTGASPLDRHYELIGSILVRMASGGLERISVNFANVGKVLALNVPDSVTATNYRDVLQWMLHEDLLWCDERSDKGGHWLFKNLQLTARGIAIIQERLPGGEGNMGSIQAVAQQPHGELPPSFYTKAGSFVGGLLGGLTKTLSS